MIVLTTDYFVLSDVAFFCIFMDIVARCSVHYCNSIPD